MKGVRSEYFTRAERYFNEYRQTERDLVTKRREARKRGEIYVEAEPKVALVIRTKGLFHHAPKVRKILQLFRLHKPNNAVFIKLNKATKKMLQEINYAVSWGYPTVGTISKLIYKRGYGKVHKQRIPLTTNEVIEQTLSKHGIICVEDIIHEIATCGPHFKQANNFLWPFKLSSPLGGARNKRHNFVDGGQYGNREDFINALARSMI